MIMYDRICIQEGCGKKFQSGSKRKDIRCPDCAKIHRKAYFDHYNQMVKTNPKRIIKTVVKETIPLTYDEGYGHLQAFMGDKGDITI